MSKAIDVAAVNYRACQLVVETAQRNGIAIDPATVTVTKPWASPSLNRHQIWVNYGTDGLSTLVIYLDDQDKFETFPMV